MFLNTNDIVFRVNRLHFHTLCVWGGGTDFLWRLAETVTDSSSNEQLSYFALVVVLDKATAREIPHLCPSSRVIDLGPTSAASGPEAIVCLDSPVTVTLRLCTDCEGIALLRKAAAGCHLQIGPHGSLATQSSAQKPSTIMKIGPTMSLWLLRTAHLQTCFLN